MRYGSIHIPEGVINAYADGSLAIFAGAGVSYDPPSSYPDFEGLAKEAGTAFMPHDEQYWPTDQFFGRLDRACPHRVHEWVRTRLSSGTSEPNPHHVTLLKLFRSPDRVRIVTTNFDSHFSAAAKELFSTTVGVEEFFAPALPTGSHFAGLVYLHGAVCKPADRLVLTDYDFGRAYLTEGWACRFLVELFRSYTVLFVGYSGDDTVVQYLARGLPPDSNNAFAFAKSESECEQWAQLHIKPILYPYDAERRDYSALWAGVERLADDVNRNALDHERRIITLIAQTPPLADTDDNDYLEAVFKDERRSELFCRHAQSWVWVEWAGRQGLLGECFKYLGTGSVQFLQACRWLSVRMAEAKGDAAIRLFIEHKKCISLALFQYLLRTLGDGGDFRNPAVRALISLLLDSPHAKYEEDVLVMYMLATKLTPDTSPDFCLTVFRFLITPRLSASVWPSLSTPFDANEKPWIRYEVDCAERAESINHLWEGVLKRDLSRFAMPVVSAISDALQINRHLWNLTQDDVSDWDELTIIRPEIANAPKYSTSGEFQALIEIHLQCAEWLMMNRVEVFKALLEFWLASEAPMLRRLALFNLAQDTTVESAVLLDRVLASGFLTKGGVEAEVVRLIRKRYPTCGEDFKKRFIVEAERQILSVDGAESQQKDLGENRLFGLLSVLMGADGGPCPIAKPRLEGVLAKHPKWSIATFQRGREGVVDVGSLPPPIAPESLLAEPPTAHLELLLTFKDGDPFKGEPQRSNLCQVVAQAVMRQPGWGLALGTLLEHKGDVVPSDLWHAFVQGMRDAALDDGQWHEVISLFNRSALPLSVVSQICMFLASRLEKKEALVPYECLSEVFGLCRRLWRIDQSEREPIAGNNPALSRVSMALNRTGGIVVQCVLAIALRTRQHAQDDWTGLPQKFRDFLEDILSNSGVQGFCGQCRCAEFLAHFLSVDQEWSREHILPLFEGHGSKANTARAVWESHGIMGRVFADVAQDVVPIYLRNTALWESLDTEAISGLTSKMVVLLLWGRLSEDEQLQILAHMSANGGSKTLAAFARQIGAALRELEYDVKRKAWETWIRRWLESRAFGSGRSMGDEELGALAAWASDVPDFPAFVAEITRADGRLTGTFSHVLHGFKEKRLHVDSPSDTINFIKWFLEHADVERWEMQSFEELVGAMVKLPNPPHALGSLLIKMGEISAPSALTLYESWKEKSAK